MSETFPNLYISLSTTENILLIQKKETSIYDRDDTTRMIVKTYSNFFHRSHHAY